MKRYHKKRKNSVSIILNDFLNVFYEEGPSNSINHVVIIVNDGSTLETVVLCPFLP